MFLGTIQLIQIYKKARKLTGDEAPVSRFLPKALAVLLFTYLSEVRPVQEAFFKAIGQQVATANWPYVFVAHGKRMTAEQIRTAATSTLTLAFSAYRYHSLSPSALLAQG